MPIFFFKNKQDARKSKNLFYFILTIILARKYVLGTQYSPTVAKIYKIIYLVSSQANGI